MRFTDEIIFVKRSSDSKYDPDLGEWVEGKPERTRTEANVTDIGTDKSIICSKWYWSRWLCNLDRRSSCCRSIYIQRYRKSNFNRSIRGLR